MTRLIYVKTDIDVIYCIIYNIYITLVQEGNPLGQWRYYAFSLSDSATLTRYNNLILLHDKYFLYL